MLLQQSADLYDLNQTVIKNTGFKCVLKYAVVSVSIEAKAGIIIYLTNRGRLMTITITIHHQLYSQ
jgi:hypothetical protein